MKSLLIPPLSLATEHGEQEQRVHLNSGMTQTSECFKGLDQFS